MAVDFAVPLITNVKVAKLLFEALIRRLPLEVSPVDFKTSHQTHTFPSLVNIASFIPGLTSTTSDDFAESLKASISGGFSTAIVLPIGDNCRIEDEASLDQARANLAKVAHSNFALGVTASSTNVKVIDEELEANVKSLFVPFMNSSLDLGISDIAAHFASWPTDKPIVTNAKGTDLAPVLLFADLHGRSLHITDVQSKDDLLLITLSKAKQLKVTCDVAIYSLFFTREQFPGSTCLPSEEDQKAIWKNLEAVDAFSVGNVPYRLARELNKDASAWSGVEEALPLLLTAVSEGRLTLQDIQTRLHDNPTRIFSLPDQAHTNVEVVIGRRAHISSGTENGSVGRPWTVNCQMEQFTECWCTARLHSSTESCPQLQQGEMFLVPPSAMLLNDRTHSQGSGLIWDQFSPKLQRLRNPLLIALRACNLQSPPVQ